MEEKTKKFLKEWVFPFLAEFIVLGLFLNFVVNVTVVPSGSMLPTIAEYSLLLCPRVYNTEKLERGDIISFQSDELDKILIKRLIGLPGEHVEINAEGVVSIDGEVLEEEYVVYQMTDYPCTFDVPEGHYLFLGDNRSGSADARMWDDPYIPADAIISRAKFTVWPPRNFGFLE